MDVIEMEMILGERKIKPIKMGNEIRLMTFRKKKTRRQVKNIKASHGGRVGDSQKGNNIESNETKNIKTRFGFHANWIAAGTHLASSFCSSCMILLHCE
jgi:hypothetical protein